MLTGSLLGSSCNAFSTAIIAFSNCSQEMVGFDAPQFHGAFLLITTTSRERIWKSFFHKIFLAVLKLAAFVYPADLTVF